MPFFSLSFLHKKRTIAAAIISYIMYSIGRGRPEWKNFSLFLFCLFWIFFYLHFVRQCRVVYVHVRANPLVRFFFFFIFFLSFFLSLLCYRTYQQQSFLLTYLLCLSLLLLLVDVHFVWLFRSDPMGKYRKSIGLERQKNQGADMAHKENKRERERERERKKM